MLLLMESVHFYNLYHLRTEGGRTNDETWYYALCKKLDHSLNGNGKYLLKCPSDLNAMKAELQV